jgi:hypothetical protein
VDWIDLDQDRGRWRALVNSVLNLIRNIVHISETRSTVLFRQMSEVTGPFRLASKLVEETQLTLQLVDACKIRTTRDRINLNAVVIHSPGISRPFDASTNCY